MTPLPTPYDITPIPHIPYAPGLRDWLILASILAACAIALLSITRQRIRRSVSPLERARTQLAHLEESLHGPHLSRANCFTASQTTKRAIDAALGTDLHAATIDELQALSESHPSEALREIAGMLASWDRAKFGRTDETAIPREQIFTVRMHLVTLGHRGLAAGDEDAPRRAGP